MVITFLTCLLVKWVAIGSRKTLDDSGVVLNVGWKICKLQVHFTFCNCCSFLFLKKTQLSCSISNCIMHCYYILNISGLLFYGRERPDRSREAYRNRERNEREKPREREPREQRDSRETRHDRPRERDRERERGDRDKAKERERDRTRDREKLKEGHRRSRSRDRSSHRRESRESRHSENSSSKVSPQDWIFLIY